MCGNSGTATVIVFFNLRPDMIIILSYLSNKLKISGPKKKTRNLLIIKSGIYCTFSQIQPIVSMKKEKKLEISDLEMSSLMKMERLK